MSLSQPNPLTNPLLGDGSNQYVYDTQQPDGFLAVPAWASAPGAATADTTWALPHVGLFVSPAMPSGALPFQWLSSGSQMYVYTPGSYPSPDGVSPGASYRSAAFIYQGLPPDNTGFGDHTMTMKVDNTVSQIANYQLFFNSTAINYPGALTPTSMGYVSSGILNWYYYYNLLYPSGGTYQNSSASSNTSKDLFGNISTTICNDAHGPFLLNTYRVGSDGNIEHAGILYMSGIHTFIYDCAHEATHRQYLSSGTDSGNSDGQKIKNNPNATTPAQDPTGDWDGDGLTNAWEIAHHLNPLSGDTTGDYGGHAIGDAEVYADIGGWGVLALLKGAWQQDWANDGLQFGNWFATDPIVNPACITPRAQFYHPWAFRGSGVDFNMGQFQTDPDADILAAMPN